MLIVDADAHWIETEQELLQRAGIVRPRVMPRDGWDRTLAGAFPERRPDAADRLRFMDQNGIARAVMHPTRCMSLGMIPEREVAAKIAEAFHEYALEACAAFPGGRLIPMALAVPQHIRHTVKMLETYKASGFAGVLLLPHGHGKMLGDEEFFEFYETCSALQLTVTIHPNSFGAIGIQGYTRFAEVHAVSFPFELIRQFVSMVCSGVFERFPRLHVAFLEAGAGWIPYWLNRLDGEFEKRRAELPISLAPSIAVRQAKVFVSCSGWEPQLAEVNEMLGGGVMWQSDYPHWDHVGKTHAEAIARSLSTGLARKILCENAADCYRVRLDQDRDSAGEIRSDDRLKMR